jgi:serine/threonine-protein kinase
VKPAEGGIESGTIVAGKYRIESILGKGGMGIVYRAYHLALEEDVAIKVLRREVSRDQETSQRFEREAQSAAKLKSEHVARIKDVGMFEDGLPYMVMEFLEGADLGQMVDTHGAMTIPVAVDLVLQACDAIVEAHSLGIVHRDIKPTNLFVSFRPDQSAIVKVLDFGISKSANGTDLSLTQTQSMLGTPAYMSPEQMRSARSVDARTDVWSIGTVLYELVEGRRPFEAESFSEMCVMVAVDPPARMTKAIDLDPVIVRCLAKQPADRYPHVAELMRDLAAFAGNPEAAHRYVKRAYRTLGLPVPLSMESSPNIQRLALYTTPVPGPSPTLVYDAASAAMAVANAAPTATSHARTIEDPPRVRRSSRGLAIGAVLVAAVGVVTAVGIMHGTARDEPAMSGSSTGISDPGSGSAARADEIAPGSAAAVGREGSAASAAVAGEGSGSGSAVAGEGSSSGSAATVASKPTTIKKPSSTRRPPVVKPPVVKPPVVKPQVRKPACDVYANPRGCN